MRVLLGLIKTMRPKQWIKNGFVFIPLIFDVKLLNVYFLLRAGAGFALFCLVSSVVYIINDLVDIEKDRQHPKKRFRPLASGQLPKRVAIAAAVVLALVTLPLGFLLVSQGDYPRYLFGMLLAGYFVLQLGYSFKLKNVVLLDVFVNAAGFVIRVAAGVPLVDAARFSPWLYIFTINLALFLALGKRRGERMLLKENANAHRESLQEYNLPLLDEMMSIVTTSTVVVYALYTFSAVNLPANHTMMLTIPFVLYGVFRYLYLIHQRGETAPPDELVLRDRPLQIDLVLFGLAVFLILYFG